MIGDAANAIEVVARDLWVAVAQSFNDLLIRQSDCGLFVVLLRHNCKFIKNSFGT